MTETVASKEMNKNKGDEQEKKIRELKERIRVLEERGEVSEGTAASILKSLGELIPGLGGLVNGLKKSEAFRERLNAIDREIEASLRSQPLKRKEEGQPSFQSGFSQRTMSQAKREVIVSKEPSVDVFDEETCLRVLAELPGIEEEDIKVSLNETRLVISTDTPSHKYYKEVTLPYAPRGRVHKLYQKGVLELTFSKE